MSGTKHTPGPWEHIEDPNRSEFDITEDVKSYVVDQLRPNDAGEMGAWQTVAHVCGGDTNEECEANARVIAAAPAMLAEIKLLATATGTWLRTGVVPSTRDLVEAHSRLIALLVAAHGPESVEEPTQARDDDADADGGPEFICGAQQCPEVGCGKFHGEHVSWCPSAEVAASARASRRAPSGSVSEDPVTLTITMSRAAWEALSGIIGEFAESHGYGNFPGGDPREFEPDPDCSTEEERAAHKRDCEAMNAGGQALMPPTGEWHHTERGVVHFHRQAYGLGSYVQREPALIEARDALHAARKP